METNQEKGENDTPRLRWMGEVESDVRIMGVKSGEQELRTEYYRHF